MGRHSAPPQRPQLSDRSAQSVARMGRGSIANLAGVVLSVVTGFGVTVLITRGLSKEDAGVFFSCTSLFLLAVSVGQLGTTTGLVYFLSRARTLLQPELLRPYLRTAARPVYVAAALTGLALIVFAPQIARATNPEHVETATMYLRILGVFTPFASIKTLNLSASRGMGTMRPTVLVEQIGRPVVQFVLVGLVVLLDINWLLPFAWAISFVLGAAGGRQLLQRRIAAAGEATEPPRPVGREFWVFTWPRALANVAAMAMQRFDIVLVGALAGAAPAAIYTASTRFLVLGQLGNRAVSTSAQPRLAEALARGVAKDVNDIYRTSTAWLMIATWPAYLLFATVGGPLLGVFGSGYTEGRQVVALLSIAMLIATGCGMVDMVVNMGGRTSWNLINVLIALGVQMTLDVILIPRIGIMGAAIGWSAAIVAQNIFSVTLLTTRAGLHPFGRSTVTVAVGALLCYGAVPLAVKAAMGEGISTAIIAAIAGTLPYVVFLWAFRHTLHLRSLFTIRRRRRSQSGEQDGGPHTIDPEA